MARRQVVEVICDRCGRTETQEPIQEAKAGPELTVKFQGETKEYIDLCIRCRKACGGYFKSLTKKIEKEPEQKPAPAPKKTGLLGLGGKG